MKTAVAFVVAILSSGSAVAADFSGAWRIENVFRGSTSIITCTIAQSANALTGICKPQVDGIAGADLTGTVDGSSAKWGYDVVFNGTPARVDYSATMGADGSLQGELFRSGSPSPITAVRQ